MSTHAAAHLHGVENSSRNCRNIDVGDPGAPVTVLRSPPMVAARLRANSWRPGGNHHARRTAARSLIPPFVLVVLNAIVAELRIGSEVRPNDARIRSAVSSIDAAIRSLSNPQG